MTEPAEAAMQAIEEALRHPKPTLAERLRRMARNLFRRPPSRRDAESRAALAVLRAQCASRNPDYRAAKAALESIGLLFGLTIVTDEDLWGDTDPPIRIDEHQLDDALHFARRGMVGDVIHHLARALPAEYAPITDALAAHARTRP